MHDAPFADRPLPAWYDDAKFGIFIHWGPYAVPCWAPVDDDMGEMMRSGDWTELFRRSPYTEWYLNSIALDGSPSAIHHAEVNGSRPYASFVDEFAERCRAVDIGAWADLFAFAGARYVVPVTKHHDGFLMWRSARANPVHGARWTCPVDVIGDLASAVRSRGMRFGTYYSGGIDWTFTPPPIADLPGLVRSIPDTPEYHEYLLAHVDELIDRFAPSVLWNDIGWPRSLDPLDVIRRYYDAVPDGVVNDRFDLIATMQGRLHADFSTPEYSTTPHGARKWETCRGIGRSFGYNRNEPESSLLDPSALVRLLVDVVSRGGNLLLNVGPTADGSIPAAQAIRLAALGWWLRAHGDAVYGTHAWTRPSASTGDGQDVRYTVAGDGSALHAIVLGTPPGRSVSIDGLSPVDGTEVRLDRGGPALPWTHRNDALVVTLPDHLPESPAVVLTISPPPVAG